MDPTQESSGLTIKYWTRVEMLDIYKHVSLLPYHLYTIVKFLYRLNSIDSLTLQ